MFKIYEEKSRWHADNADAFRNADFRRLKILLNLRCQRHLRHLRAIKPLSLRIDFSNIQ